jgi:hypothetical protein
MWPVFLPIIARYGIEFAMQLWQNVKNKAEPTQEQWDALIQLSKKTADDYLAEAQGRRQ